MASKYSTYATYLLSTSLPPQRVEQGDLRGRMHYLYDEYQGSVDLGASDVVNFAPLPAGARVLSVELSFPDEGTTGTAKLGWAASAQLDSSGVAVVAADDDGFLASVDLKTAADTVNMGDQANVPGFGKKFAAVVVPQLTMTEATNSINTTSPIKLCIGFILD